MTHMEGELSSYIGAHQGWGDEKSNPKRLVGDVRPESCLKPQVLLPLLALIAIGYLALPGVTPVDNIHAQIQSLVEPYNREHQSGLGDDEPKEFTGILTAIYGDGQSGETNQFFWLNSEDGKSKVELELSQEQQVSAAKLIGKRVSIKGITGDKIAALEVNGLEQSGATNSDESEALGSQPTISILCKYNDVHREPVKPPFIDELFAENYPALGHFLRQLSNGQSNFEGSEGRGWFTLPKPRDAYIKPDGYPDWDLLVKDCTALADASTDFTKFKGLNLMFNDDVDNFGSAWGGQTVQTLDGQTRVWPVAWIPPWAYQQGIIAHELIGHGIGGWPHVYVWDGTTEYFSGWDFMSPILVCMNSDPRLGCIARNTININKNSAGWISADRKLTVGTGGLAFITLEQSLLPSEAGITAVEIPLPGTNPARSLFLETRRPAGYELFLGVLVSEKDDSRPKHYILRQPGQDTSLLPGEEFDYAGVNVRICEETATGFTITVGNQQAVPVCLADLTERVYLPLTMK